jgi:hypothetical protein
MIAPGVSRLAERDRHQQPPEFVPIRQVKLASSLASAEALEHALDHILLIRPDADFPVQVPPRQIQEIPEIALPDLASRLVADRRVL